MHADQFVALACTVLIPRCSRSFSSTPTTSPLGEAGNSSEETPPSSSSSSRRLNPPRCGAAAGLWDLPKWIVVESVGRNWVMKADRNVVASLRHVTRDAIDADDDDVVFFRLSHTLGALGPDPQPQSVSLMAECLGWIGGTKVIQSHYMYEAGTALSVCGLSSGGRAGFGSDSESNSSSEEDEKEVVEPQEFFHSSHSVLCSCCNKKWLLVCLKGESDVILVWKICDGVVMEPPGRLSTSLAGMQVLSLQFFGPTEYNNHSDVVEVILTSASKKSEYSLSIWHLDFTDAVVGANIEGYKVSVVTEGTALEPDLWRPLIKRRTKEYFIPLLLKKTRDPNAVAQDLLVLNTMETIPWFTCLPRSTVQALDETHLCATDSGHTTTQVFSIPPYVPSPPKTKKHKKKKKNREGKKHAAPPTSAKITPLASNPPPCSVIHHPPGTCTVFAGCGILVASTLSMSSAAEDDDDRGSLRDIVTVKRRRIQREYTTLPQHPLVGTLHRFVDAFSGTVIFEIKYNQTILPVSLKPVPFHSPIYTEDYF
ncbi:hypothetical protein Pelo_17427 [Pelomyxa schiedti]|nr:hypothetical protein Pelo_17427 [Pelomyxa schiedti]